MKRPWQIWLCYAAGLVLVVSALSWLTVQGLRLEREREKDRQETELARREAELQERVSSALWRMDGMLTPLIAQEAARPYYLYEPFYRAPAAIVPPPRQTIADPAQQVLLQQQQAANVPQTGDPSVPADAWPAQVVPGSPGQDIFGQPSPLLIQPSEFVFLHFQLGPGNHISSPQRPEGEAKVHAMMCCGLTPSAVETSDSRLEQIRKVVNYETLLELCPDARLPTFTWPSTLSQPDGSGNSPDHSIRTMFVAPQTESEWFPGQTDYQLHLGTLPNADESVPAEESAEAAGAEPVGKQQAQVARNMVRGNEEYNRRVESAQKHAYSQWMDNSQPGSALGDMASLHTPDAFVSEGIMRPLWLEDNLLLARRVENQNGTVIQCCWLDWERIREALREEVRDLLPEVQFEPLNETTVVRLGQVLATLPVQLQIDRPRLAAMLDLGVPSVALPRGGGIWLALVMAWSCLGLAAVGGAALLHGLLRLSERRGAFVSAVTHELRTPLTTFRMYAEMLAERMVPGPEKQQQYAETMRVEADRLSHLVENVLQFARLERVSRQCRSEATSWERLMDRFGDRLRQRTEQGSMKLVDTTGPGDSGREFFTDPAAVEQILFNLVDNACKYARKAGDRRIEIGLRSAGRHLEISIRDYGPGIDAGMRRRMFQAFSKSDQQAADTAQGVGLGLALCRRMAKSLGGSLRYQPRDPGTEMILELPERRPKT